MIEIRKVGPADVLRLTETQTRTFDDDSKNKPPGCGMEGPLGYDSVDWSAGWLGQTPYFKILAADRIVGGIIVFDMGSGHYELGRIWVDPEVQNQGIGQLAMQQLFAAFPDAWKWTLGTPVWVVRNQHFYEKMGSMKVGVTEVDPHLGWAGVEYERICG